LNYSSKTAKAFFSVPMFNLLFSHYSTSDDLDAFFESEKVKSSSTMPSNDLIMQQVHRCNRKSWKKAALKELIQEAEQAPNHHENDLNAQALLAKVYKADNTPARKRQRASRTANSS